MQLVEVVTSPDRPIDHPRLPQQSQESGSHTLVSEDVSVAPYLLSVVGEDTENVDPPQAAIPSWLPGHRVSAIIPALNEVDNLRLVLAMIPACVDEVILVDGHSTDGTIEMVQTLYPDVRIVIQDGQGKGDALRCGIRAATGDIIVMLDADGSTDPGEIPLFVETLLAGADFAKGSRFLRGGGTDDMPLYRRIGNWGFVVLVGALFGRRYSDMCYGYNALRANAARALELDADGFEIETMMNIRALRAGLKVIEVPSFEDRRVYGEGRLRTIPDGWRVLKTICREWVTNLRGRAPGTRRGVLAAPYRIGVTADRRAQPQITTEVA